MYIIHMYIWRACDCISEPAESVVVIREEDRGKKSISRVLCALLSPLTTKIGTFEQLIAARTRTAPLSLKEVPSLPSPGFTQSKRLSDAFAGKRAEKSD